MRFIILLSLFMTSTVWACPNCHAYGDANKPPYTIIILGIFILITYIPFYFLFSAAKKYDPKNSVEESKGPL